jgi:hypothetical protein
MQAWIDGDEGAGNICLRMPHHVLGIDVDHYGTKHGGDTLADAEHEYGELPATWRTTSRGDGISGIRFYRVPEGMRWPGELGPDTELIQHRHRYALVWPSVHPSGAQYIWLTPDGQRSTQPPHVDELPLLPEPWVIALTGGATATNTPRNALPATAAVQWLADRPAAADPCSRVAAALAAATNDLRTGSRHAAARDATGRLVRLAAEGHPGVYAAIGQFGEAFLAACNDAGRGSLRPPDVAQHEFLSMLTGAVNLVTADPAVHHGPAADPCIVPFDGILLPAPALSSLTAAAPAGSGQTPQQLDPLYAQEMHHQRIRRAVKKALDNEEAMAGFRWPESRPTVRAELALPDNPTIYTVHDLMPVGANVLLTAQFKAGKTTMVDHLMRCLADKEPFLGHYDVANLAGRVAAWNYEVDEGQYRRWLRELNIANDDRATILNLRGYRIPFTVPHVEDKIVAWLKDHDVQVWIIDPFARAFLGSGDSENDNTQVGEFLEAIDVIKVRAGVSDVVMPVHTGRADMEAGAEHARGATRLDDWADVRWIYTTDESGSRYFRASGRDVEQPEGRVDYIAASRRLVIDHGRGRGQEKEDRIGALIVALVEQQPGISYKRLRDGIRDRLGHVDNKATDAVRLDLIRTNRIRYVSPDKEGQAGKHWPAYTSDLIAGYDDKDKD